MQTRKHSDLTSRKIPLSFDDDDYLFLFSSVLFFSVLRARIAHSPFDAQKFKDIFNSWFNTQNDDNLCVICVQTAKFNYFFVSLPPE